MKLAILGYGKMGQAIEIDALTNGHEIVLKINENNLHDLTIENLKKADVAIEFSTPATVLDNIYMCFDASIPIIVGTTGWYDNIRLIEADCECRNAALFYATNFSIGVNIFFQISEMLAKIMNYFPSYLPEIHEVHHTQKLDSPSGTAITIADGMIAAIEQKSKWVNFLANRKSENALIQPTNDIAAVELPIYSEREGDINGIHTVNYISENDKLSFTHEAFNRKGFAQGAVLAAEWMIDKQGIYTMRDLLSFIAE